MKLFKRSFYKKKRETFKTGPLDIFVILVVLCVFLYAFFIDSFKQAYDENGDPIFFNDSSGNLVAGMKLNLQVFIAPLIMVYEMFLLTLEGKKRGRYLPWGFYFRMCEYYCFLQLQDGKRETREYFELRRNRKLNKKNKNI